MKNLRVSNRYAKALWGLAKESDISQQAYDDMQLIYKSLSANKDLKTILSSPIVRISKKQNIIRTIFKDKVHPVTMQYLTIIVRKKRALLIEGIAFEYLKLHKQNLDIETVTLITAAGVDPDTEERARSIATNITSKSKIEFQSHLKPDIVGGFILRIGDLQYDASIKRKLSNIKRELLGN